MLVDQDSQKTENDNFILKTISDLPNKFNSADDRGIEIDSVESLYDYGRSVVQSNLQYIISYFENTSDNHLASDVCIRHGNLLTQTKIAVKRVMEEAATRKFIYFNNSTVNCLCVAVENCLLDGLQRRIISLFEESHSLQLLKKISKDCDSACFVLNKVNNFSDYSAPYSATNNIRFFQDNDHAQKSPNSMSLPNAITGLFNKQKQSTIKNLWIKLAMVDKKLLLILEHIMQHHQQYYDENSIMSTCLSGSIFMELIAGPCSLDYSLVKPSEHIWNDPDASELLTRHKMHSHDSWPIANGENIYRSVINSIKTTKNRPYLKIKHHMSPLQIQDSKLNPTLTSIFNMNTSQSDGSTCSTNAVAKEYVESLHQNVKHILLYGKNNVVVQPKEDLDEMQGYLSLHLIAGDRLRLNWTPNKLMNHETAEVTHPRTSESPRVNIPNPISPECIDGPHALHNRLLEWDSALSINMEDIIYLHCHNSEQDGGKITLVCQDGVQHPPLKFPPGGHLLLFLTCLENGLIPFGSLDPPLLQLNDAEKTFPARNRRPSTDSSIRSDGTDQSKYKPSIVHSLLNNFNKSILKHKDVQSEEDLICTPDEADIIDYTNCDFVFKVVYLTKDISGNPSYASNPCTPHNSADTYKDDQDPCQMNGDQNAIHANYNDVSTIDTLCSLMRQQILSRAFYGWLQHYRNIKIVKTQLKNLVHPGSVQSDIPYDASEGLTSEIWNEYKITQTMTESEIYRLIYFGGCASSIRHEVWPRLLDHYSWTTFDTSEIDCLKRLKYEKSLSQWKALEVILKRRDNESVIGSIEQTVDMKPSKLILVRQSEVSNNSIDGNNCPQTASSIINISNCEITPSEEFQSVNDGDNVAELAETADNIFKEREFSCMSDNMHRIDKDVDRCDRNNPYFSSHSKHGFKGNGNLRKLRNIMITWVWEHIDVGYVQGMCDLLAPLLVVLDDESLTHACFTKLMETMLSNFPQISSKMDENLSMMALLLQITDRNLYDHMCPDSEVTSLYVSYRWFLLDFKRELCYSDVFCVWETIWSARHVASNHFNLFLALSFLQYYRNIILDNTMEYTDIIKFYNEMAEKHEVQKLLFIARALIESVRDIIQCR